ADHRGTVRYVRGALPGAHRSGCGTRSGQRPGHRACGAPGLGTERGWLSATSAGAARISGTGVAGAGSAGVSGRRERGAGMATRVEELQRTTGRRDGFTVRLCEPLRPGAVVRGTGDL